MCKVIPVTGTGINLPLKASPGRGKLSPQVTDEGAGKQQFAGNYPSSGAARHPLPLLSLRDIFPRKGETYPQRVKAFAPVTPQALLYSTRSRVA